MQGSARTPFVASTPTQDRMQQRRESLDGINMTPVVHTHVVSGSRSEPATPAPSAPERMETSISMEAVGFQPITNEFADMHCPACFETDWTERAHIFAQCGHRYHIDCFNKIKNMNLGHPRCSWCNMHLFTPPPGVLVDSRGIRIPTPPPDPAERQRNIDETRRLQEQFDAADRGEGEWPPVVEEIEVDELLDSPPERAPQPRAPERMPTSNDPQDGTYHEPNKRGEIIFIPNENYGNSSVNNSVNNASQVSQTTGSNSSTSSFNSPYRPGCKIITRKVDNSFSQQGGGTEYLVLVENVDGSRRTWKEYHPAGAPRLPDIINGQEVPDNVPERPRTPRGTVHEESAAAEQPMDDAASAAEPPTGDAATAADEEIQVVQHVVGNPSVIIVNVEAEHPDYEDDNDSEPIGMAALEQMGIDDVREQQSAAAAADAADAEAAQYLAEVEADTGNAAEVDAGEQFRAELETGAGAEPEARVEDGADSMPELESMEEE